MMKKKPALQELSQDRLPKPQSKATRILEALPPPKLTKRMTHGAEHTPSITPQKRRLNQSIGNGVEFNRQKSTGVHKNAHSSTFVTNQEKLSGWQKEQTKRIMIYKQGSQESNPRESFNL